MDARIGQYLIFYLFLVVIFLGGRTGVYFRNQVESYNLFSAPDGVLLYWILSKLGSTNLY